MKINRIGVDLAKNVFQLHGADHKDKAIWKRKLSRDKWLKVLFETAEPGTVIGMDIQHIQKRLRRSHNHY